MDYTRLTLAETRTALGEIARDAQNTFGALDGRQLNWRPDETRWGVAQCLEHLLASNRLMLQSAHSALDDSQPRTIWQRLPVWPRLLGPIMVRSLTPSATRKFKAPPAARPVFTALPDDIVRRFADQQREIAAWLETVDQSRADRTILTSPFVRVVTYSLMDACRLIVAHDRRHMEQARRVMALPEFPKPS